MTTSTGATSAALADLVDSMMRLGREALGLLRTDPMSVLTDAASRTSTTLASGRRQMQRLAGDCGCEIPQPCWMPERLGRVTSHACPGSTATVQLKITNCGMAPRAITAWAAGVDAEKVTITPAQETVAPFESGTITAKVTVPEAGEGIELQLWVRGCRDHVLPWSVSVSKFGCDCSHEVVLEDCPDLIHHWYDHFYCARPCVHGEYATHG